MRIAIPTANDRLSLHFGHCESFELFDIDQESNKVTAHESAGAPPHQPGLLPRWLAEKGVQVVIAGGMGRRAQELFSQSGIEVVIGAPSESPDKLVSDYLAGALKTGANICDH